MNGVSEVLVQEGKFAVVKLLSGNEVGLNLETGKELDKSTDEIRALLDFRAFILKAHKAKKLVIWK